MAGPTTTALAAAEVDALRRMREEEKLAHDVYRALESNSFVFERIQGAERHHFAMVGMLLQRHGVADPAKPEPGVFTDPALQARYRELVDQGKVSRQAALATGVEVEEQDLRDLAEALAQTKQPGIRHVYENLSRATRNHLRAFHHALVAEGGTYTPKFLDRTAFEQILAAPMEPGMGMGRGMGAMGMGQGCMGGGGMGAGCMGAGGTGAGGMGPGCMGMDEDAGPGPGPGPKRGPGHRHGPMRP